MCHYLSLLLCWTYLYVSPQGNWLFLRHLALRDSVLIAFQAATDGRLIGGCHAGDYLQLPRFIIGVLITTGFAKISAIFINSETEAILPTDTGYWECDRSWIKSWIGEYCKNSRSTCGRIWLICSELCWGACPADICNICPQLLQNLILPNKNSAKLLIGLARLFVMNNFQSTVPSHKLIIILLDLIANMKPHTFPPERAAAKKRKLLLAGNNFLRLPSSASWCYGSEWAVHWILWSFWRRCNL